MGWRGHGRKGHVVIRDLRVCVGIVRLLCSLPPSPGGRGWRGRGERAGGQAHEDKKAFQVPPCFRPGLAGDSVHVGSGRKAATQAFLPLGPPLEAPHVHPRLQVPPSRRSTDKGHRLPQSCEVPRAVRRC